MIGLFTIRASAAPCEQRAAERAVYGAGGSAFTPILRHIGSALAGLPAQERITLFYSDPGRCLGYEYFRAARADADVSFRYWDADGLEHACEAPQTRIQFAAMETTESLCPGAEPLQTDAARFAAFVQSFAFITHHASDQETISAVAAYHIYGFGSGAVGRSVAPWTVPDGVFVRREASALHQFIASAIGVSASDFVAPAANISDSHVQVVHNFGETAAPEPTLGYASVSTAQAGELREQTKVLAYQHFDQSCAYLPDATRDRADRKNVRSGQYGLWTPAWLITRVTAQGVPTEAEVADLIGWFEGSSQPPGSVNVLEVVVAAGEVPLCAMQALRPLGDLSAIQSYAPAAPCNGWYEQITTGASEHAACDTSAPCTSQGQVCRFGFCETH